MEIMLETKTYLVHMQCEECKEGYMLDETSDETLQVAAQNREEVKYFHKCNKCGHIAYYDTPYPYPKIVPIDGKRSN